MSKLPNHLKEQENMVKQMRKNNPGSLPQPNRPYTNTNFETGLNDFVTPYSNYRTHNNPRMRHQQQVYNNIVQQRQREKVEKQQEEYEKAESQKRIVVNRGINLLNLQRNRRQPTQPVDMNQHNEHNEYEYSDDFFGDNDNNNNKSNSLNPTDFMENHTNNANNVNNTQRHGNGRVQFQQKRTPIGKNPELSQSSEYHSHNKSNNYSNNKQLAHQSMRQTSSVNVNSGSRYSNSRTEMRSTTKNSMNSRSSINANTNSNINVGVSSNNKGKYTYTIFEKVSYYDTLHNLLQKNPKWVEVPNQGSGTPVDFSDYDVISPIKNFHPRLYDIIAKNKLYKHLAGEDFMPKTYVIHHRKFNGEVPDPSEASIWFLKNAYRESAKGITVMNNKEISNILNHDVIRHGDARSFYVLQPEIKNPYLYYPNPVKSLDEEGNETTEDWGEGHKIDMRFHVVIKYVPSSSSGNGGFGEHGRGKDAQLSGKLEIWLHKEGYVHVSSVPYTTEKSDKLIHVLHIGIHKKNQTFDKEIHQLTLGELPCLDEIMPQVHNIIRKSIESIKDGLNWKKPHYAVLGYDMLLDQDKKVWLIEINKNPGWTLEVSSQRVIENTLIPTMKDFIKLILDPIARSNHEHVSLTSLTSSTSSSGQCGGFELIGEYKI